MTNLFWTTISCIKGVGSKTLIKLYEQHPSLNFDTVLPVVKEIKQKRIRNLLTEENIETAKDKAKKLIQLHKEKDIATIPLSSEYYPQYLKLIPDPPPIIYAKGNKDLLVEKKTLAIVGTREPTRLGYKASQKIAKTFAEKGYVIVSGLALGIDTAAHEGALMAHNGKTIAVLAGQLTEIYPAKNRSLAEKILEKGGLFISETPIGQPNSRGNFVKRNRIQSGLSLGVCPVQTPLKSGTQHTIKFAKDQDRFLFTPVPLKQDINENAVQGNLKLMDQGVALLENKMSYEKISDMMTQYMTNLQKTYREKFEGVHKSERDNEQISLFDDQLFK